MNKLQHKKGDMLLLAYPNDGLLDAKNGDLVEIDGYIWQIANIKETFEQDYYAVWKFTVLECIEAKD